MRQLQYLKKSIIDWVEVSDPKIDGNDQAIVKPLAIARCDLDIPITQGQTLFRPPFAIGHEFVGEITTINSKESNLKVGDKVAVMFQISCGNCPACFNHHSNICNTSPDLSDYGMGKGGRDFGGALSDLVKVPYAKQMLFPLPGNADLTALASLSDNMTDAFRSVHPYLLNTDNNTVLIIGGLANSISLYTVLFARALGAEKITYISLNQDQAAAAADLGADSHHLKKWPVRWHENHDIVVDAAGDPKALNMALRSAREFGIATSVSIFFNNKVPVPYLEMYNKSISFNVGRTLAKEYTPLVLNLINSQKIDVGKIVSQTASFSEAKEAWLEPGTKLVITT